MGYVFWHLAEDRFFNRHGLNSFVPEPAAVGASNTSGKQQERQQGRAVGALERIPRADACLRLA